MAGNDPLQMLMQVAGPLLQKGGAGGLSPEMKGQIGQALQSPQIQQMIGQVLQGAAGGGGGVQGSGDGMPTPQGSGMGQGGDGSYYANGRYYQKGIDTPGMGPDQANSGYMMLMDRAMRGSQEMPSNGGDPNVMAIIQSMLDRAPGASRSIGGGPMPDMNPQGSMGPGDQRGAPQDQLPTGASGQQLMGQYIKAQDAPTDTNVEDLAAMRGYPPGMKGLSEEQILEYVQHMMGMGMPGDQQEREGGYGNRPGGGGMPGDRQDQEGGYFKRPGGMPGDQQEEEGEYNNR